MKKKELLDFTYVAHVITAILLINANGNIVDWINSLDTSAINPRAPGFIGITMLIMAFLILYGAIFFRSRVELPILSLFFIMALISSVDIISILYFLTSLLIAFMWFFYWRKPPILRL